MLEKNLMINKLLFKIKNTAFFFKPSYFILRLDLFNNKLLKVGTINDETV